MQIAPLHPKENERLRDLEALGILDTPPEENYDDIVQLASAICKTPISAVSLIDKSRQWFKAKVGIAADGTTREIAFCAHCILSDSILEVNDALEDDRFIKNPDVTGGLGIRFYAGAPILSKNGLPVGSLCVIDREPRELSDFQRETLMKLAKQVGREFELRRINNLLREEKKAAQEAHNNLQELFKIIAHDLRSPFQGFIGLTRLMEDSYNELSTDDIKEYIGLLGDSADETYELLENLLEWSIHEVGSNRYHPKSVNLYQIAGDSVHVLATSANKKKLSIEVDIAEELIVFADSRMIASVIRNLVNNAIKFTAASGKITISAKPSADQIIVTITDTGVGLDEAQIEAITQHTIQSSLGTKGESGSGIGLHLVHLFLETHHSKLTVESTPSVGTQMQFCLPASSPKA